MGRAERRNRFAVVFGVVAGLAAGASNAKAQNPEPARAVVATSAPAALTALAHVRPVKTGVYDAAKLLADAGQACPTVRAMLEALQATDVIVMIELRDRVQNGRAFTTMMGSRAGLRWLRVTVDAGQQWRQQAAFLAHELRHALEVAAAPEVRDVEGFRRLYERIGRPLGEGHFETDAAVAAENQALREAYAAPRR